MKFYQGLLIALVPVVLSGCGTLGGGQQEDKQPASVEDRGDGTGTSGAQDGSDGGAQSRGANNGSTFQGHPLDNPDTLLSRRIIYFDFDSYRIRDTDRAVIQAHAEYMAGHSGASVVLEGHSDERGSREYNIALGEKRAKSVYQLLSFQGASSNQMTTVSYGEEQPVAQGHNEQSWQENRRVEIIYKTR